MRFRNFVIFSCLAVALTQALTANAQNQPGILPFSTNENGVDLATGNVNIQFPVRSKLGKLPFWSQIVGSSYVGISSNLQFEPMVWSYEDPTTATFGYNVGKNSQCGSGVTATYGESVNGFSISDATGAVHAFPGLPNYFVGSGAAGKPCSTTATPWGPYPAVDNSGYVLTITAGKILITARNGNYWLGSCTYNLGCALAPYEYDPDGAAISAAYSSFLNTVTDTLGTTVLSGVPPQQYLGGPPTFTSTAISYLDASGNTQKYTYGYTTLNLASNFNCINSAGVVSPQDFGPNDFLGAVQRSMLTTVNMPGPSSGSYTIAYESTPGMTGYFTGRIAKITLPSGGSISYAYSGGNQGINCTYDTVPTVTVTVIDNNGNSGVYTYVSSLSTAPAASLEPLPNGFTVTRTDPLGNQTVFNFVSEFQSQAKAYQGAATGVPIKTTVTCSGGNFTSCATASVASSFKQRDVFTSYGSSPSSLTETIYDAYGNETNVRQMDFGNSGTTGQCASATAGVCTSTATTYGSWNGSSCVALGSIFDHPCDIKVSNNNTGAVFAETRITYNTTGHPTAISRWVSGSTWLTTKNTYNPSGTLASSQDPRSVTTQYGYAATGSGGCNGLLLTSTVYPVAPVGSSTQAWDCNGGVLVSSTDVNGQTTHYSHNDPLWRLTGTSSPDGGSSSTIYNMGAAKPWTIISTSLINDSSSLTTLTQLDGLARTTETEVLSDASGTDYVDTAYDAVGNMIRRSNPHRTSPSSSDGTTTFAYDALGRVAEQIGQGRTGISQWCYNGVPAISAVTNCSTHLGSVAAGMWIDYSNQGGNHWQQSIDSLGRLTEVIEPAASAQTTTLETDYGYDGLSNLLAVKQLGTSSDLPRNRSFSYDGLSRLLTIVNPETGMMCYGSWSGGSVGSGTCQNGYDGNGNLIAKTDARATKTTYTYDSLNRLVGKQYSDGTPSACYRYDLGSGGTTVANAIGHPTAEWTQSGACSSTGDIPTTAITWKTITSNDVMGRITGEQQCGISPCTTTSPANPVTMAYDLAGGLSQITNGVASSSSPGIYFGYARDSAGRLASVTSSWADSSGFPDVLFKADGSTGTTPYGPVGLLAAQLGFNSTSQTVAMSQSRSYDNQGRVTAMTTQGPSAAQSSGVTLTITPSPVAYGVAPYFVTECGSVCGTGGGQLQIDGVYVEGFTYSPGLQLPGYVAIPLALGQHKIQTLFGGDATHPATQSQLLYFNVITSSLPTPTLSLTMLSPSPIPLGESADIQITNSCGYACGQATFSVDGNYAGGAVFDDNGVGGNSLPSNLTLGTHHLTAHYYGDVSFGAADLPSTSFTVSPKPPAPTVTASVAQPLPSDEYGLVSIYVSCAPTCRSGQVFVDGAFAGGYVPDGNGNATVSLNPNLSIASHNLVVTYEGDANHSAYTSPSIPFAVTADNLPKAVITFPPAIVPAGKTNEFVFTVGVTGRKCGGIGAIFVDQAYSGPFTVDGSGNGQTATNAVTVGGHTIQINYYGTTSCAPQTLTTTFTAQ